jgi:predicted tellurium resistance membrane protein TerC
VIILFIIHAIHFTFIFQTFFFWYHKWDIRTKKEKMFYDAVEDYLTDYESQKEIKEKKDIKLPFYSYV